MNRKLLLGVAVFVGSFALGGLVTAIGGIPIPKVHDEFSYLLGADTFSRGRLTNPTHPMWEYFETFHVIHQPTYQSKYPPAQAISLALGEILWRPILGVWLAYAGAIAALFWCLTRWLPVRWAVAGAAFTALHPLVLRWSQSYWGGALALLGGALVIGGSRLTGKHDLLIAAAGALILANSRPYEGFVLVLIMLLVAGFRLLSLKQPATSNQQPLIAMAVLVAGFAWMGYYNFRVTGSAITMPYAVHERQYAVVPLFAFQQLRPAPEYRNERLREFHTQWAVSEAETSTTLEKVVRLFRGAFQLFIPSTFGEPLGQRFWPIYLSWVFLIPVVGTIVAMRDDRSLRAVLLILVVFVAALLPATWLLPHYAAPGIPLLAILLTAGLKQIARFRLVVAALILVWLASTAFTIYLVRIHPADAVSRATIEEELRTSGGKHLILVRPHISDLHFDWVANGADIDASPVVWARDRGDNAKLLAYFRDRQVWTLDPTVAPQRVVRQQ